MFVKGIYRNKKKGSLYHAYGMKINCTNAQDGQLMVEYGEAYVREVDEFLEKFELIEADPDMEKIYTIDGLEYRIAKFSRDPVTLIGRVHLVHDNMIDLYLGLDKFYATQVESVL